MKPTFQINGHDYTEYLAWDGLKPARHDLDKDGSGRNLLDGLMYRFRVATKVQWVVAFNRLDEAIMKQLESDMYATDNYVKITTLDAKTNRYVERTYYCSAINEGIQRYIGGRTVYDEVTFNITER